MPVFTALLAMAFLGERLGVTGWVGTSVSFAGVALISLGEGGSLGVDPGALPILLAAVSESLFFVFQKPYLASYGSLRFTTYAIWAGTLVMLAFAPGLPGAVGAAPLGATLSVVYLGVLDEVPTRLSVVGGAIALSGVVLVNAKSG